MAAQTDLPTTFHTDDPAMLKRELERMASSLAAYFSGFTGHPHAGVVQRRFTKRKLNDTTAAFWEITPVSLPTDDHELRISLPRPDPRNAGLMAIISRDTPTGLVYLSAPGCNVNGLVLAQLVNDVGFVWVLFDGQNYYTNPGGT